MHTHGNAPYTDTATYPHTQKKHLCKHNTPDEGSNYIVKYTDPCVLCSPGLTGIHRPPMCYVQLFSWERHTCFLRDLALSSQKIFSTPEGQRMWQKDRGHSELPLIF